MHLYERLLQEPGLPSCFKTCLCMSGCLSKCNVFCTRPPKEGKELYKTALRYLLCALMEHLHALCHFPVVAQHPEVDVHIVQQGYVLQPRQQIKLQFLVPLQFNLRRMLQSRPSVQPKDADCFAFRGCAPLWRGLATRV